MEVRPPSYNGVLRALPFAAAVSVMLVLLATSGLALATDRKVVIEEKKLEDVKKLIREGRESAEEIEGKESSILSELNKLNKSLAALKWDLRKTDKTLRKLKAKIGKASGNVERLGSEREELTERLQQRLKAIYVLRKGFAVKASYLINPESDLGRRQKLIGLIMKSDKRLIKEVEVNLTDFARELGELQRLEGESKVLRRSFRRQQIRVKREVKGRKKFLRATRREKTKQAKLLEELAVAASDLTELIKELRDESGPLAEETGFALIKGKLPRPVDGDVISTYGKVTHPQFGTVTFNNGIVIEAEYGKGVRSVHDGEVVYVGWLKGYGQVVIVAHEGGYYTLFGYLFKVLVERGEAVPAGREIGLIGDSGPEDRTGLYFEVRQGGIPRDPSAWLVSG